MNRENGGVLEQSAFVSPFGDVFSHEYNTTFWWMGDVKYGTLFTPNGYSTFVVVRGDAPSMGVSHVFYGDEGY